MTNSNYSSDYNDAHLTGACYINDFREVPTRKGSYLSLSISVIQGRKDNPEYFKIRSANVVGAQAEQITNALYQLWVQLPAKTPEPGKKFAPSKAKIFARFRIGDLQASAFMGDDGEPHPSIQGRLLNMTHVYVNNERKFEDLDELSQNTDHSQSVRAQA